MWFQKFTEWARKALFEECEHDWIKKYKIREYHDYSGFSVHVYHCVCGKCGKVEDRKYW